MFCKKCGAKIKNGAQFCPKCGTKVKEEAFSQDAPKEPSFHINQFLQKFDMEQPLQKSGVDRILRNVTKRQLIGVGAAAFAVVFAILLISGVRKGSSGKDTAHLAQEGGNAANWSEYTSVETEQKSTEPQNTEPNVQELTLDEQLALMKEYMETGDIREETLLNIMVEQHVYEPDLYLGLAEMMIVGNQLEPAIDVLVTGYQNTNDEQIKSELLDLQTRVKVGDDNADKINKALSIAKDIADDVGYGDTVEKGKNLFDTLYGVYLENK